MVDNKNSLSFIGTSANKMQRQFLRNLHTDGQYATTGAVALMQNKRS
jgi:hypothetical protein